MTRIHADLLIPGRGEPIEDGIVVVEGRTITWAGPSRLAPPAEGEGEPTIDVPVLMPGLWDCHVHFTGQTTIPMMGMPGTQRPLGIVRSVQDARVALAAGFTSVREVGGYGIHIARAVNEGTIPGPSIFAAGAMISRTGGHSDLHALPHSWSVSLEEEFGLLAQCDGVPDCLATVRRQLRLGASIIKICTSGGMMSEVESPLHQQFSDEEISAMVQEARRSAIAVAAHADGKPGIMAALRNGVHTIEHGSCIDEEAAALMKERGAVFVPTAWVNDEYLRLGEAQGVPAYADQKLKFFQRSHESAMTLAREMGVTVALGTDVAASHPSLPAHWGSNANELVMLVRSGYSPLEAIECGTANGPLTLGPRAPRSGRIRSGYDADLIAVASNPLEDISVLTQSASITHVWKFGRLVKDPETREMVPVAAAPDFEAPPYRPQTLRTE